MFLSRESARNYPFVTKFFRLPAGLPVNRYPSSQLHSKLPKGQGRLGALEVLSSQFVHL